jgi:hypothetical protein
LCTLKRITDDLLMDGAHQIDGHPIAQENVDGELGPSCAHCRDADADVNLAGMARRQKG